MKAKSNAVKPKHFLKIHSELWPLVVPEDSVKAVMDEVMHWENVEKDLNRVIASSMLGKRLFNFAIKQMLSQLVSKKIATDVAKLWGLSEVTLACIREQKRNTCEALQEMDNIELLPAKRDLLLVYRGVPVEVKVHSLAEEFDMHVACLAKGEAVQCGTLPSLFCEDDLVVKDMIMHKAETNHIHSEVLQEAREARTMANGLLKGDSCKNGDTICVTSLAA